MQIHEQEAVEVTRSTPPKVTAFNDSIPLRLALGIGGLWIAGLYVMFSLAPAPVDDPGALAILIGVAFDLSLLATLAGFAVLQRWGLMASSAGAAVLLIGAGLCSLGGHTGGWLVAQYVTGATILVTSRAAFRRF